MDCHRLAIGLALAVIALIIFLFGLNPKLRSLTWWFGPEPEAPFVVLGAIALFVACLISNVRDDRLRKGREQQRLTEDSKYGPRHKPLWPEWCTDYTERRSGDGGWFDGGDGGGDGGGCGGD